MSMRASLVAWALMFACFNWMIWKLVGIPVVYCVGAAAFAPLHAWSTFILLALVALMLFSLLWDGFWNGIRVAAVILLVAMLPQIFTAVFNLGGRC